LESATPQQLVMPNHRSFHGSITGEQAEYILSKTAEQQCYLTRYSSNHRAYILSVKEPMTPNILHYKLSIDNTAQNYEIQGTGVAFRSFEELLSFYEQSPIDATVRSIGSPCVRRSNHQRRPYSAAEGGSGDTSTLFADIIRTQHEHNATMFRQYSDLMLQQQNFFKDVILNLRRPQEENRGEDVGRLEERDARLRQRPAAVREDAERQGVERSLGPEDARARADGQQRGPPRPDEAVGPGGNAGHRDIEGQYPPQKKCVIL